MLHRDCGSDVMLLDINQKSPVPIYEQIVAQVMFGIASGALEVGEMIPSARELAGEVEVPPTPVARAFLELERSGATATRRGKGMEVTAAAPQLCRAKRQEIVRDRIRLALREAASSQLPPE